MAATDRSHSRARWIDDAGQLEQHLATWQGQPVIGVDTEFVRERTFWPRIALVQLSVPGDILLVDPLATGVPKVLAALLGDTGSVKVMHSPSEDLQVFQVACQALPRPLFDTQQAAALAGLAHGMGYQKLVSEITGIELSKGETRSDWLQRPLSERQKDYAADDVAHLHAVHASLGERLQAQGRLAWLEEDCARVVDAAESDAIDPWPHLGVRSAQMLDAEAQARLCRLLLWREQQARDADRPRSWILDNELAVSLARRPPVDMAGFHRLLDGHPRAPRQLRGALWAEVERPLTDAELDIPLATAPDDAHKARLRRLQARVADVAGQLGIAEGTLASRKQIERLMATGDWDQALGGWRQTLLRPVLAPELGGD